MILFLSCVLIRLRQLNESSGRYVQLLLQKSKAVLIQVAIFGILPVQGRPWRVLKLLDLLLRWKKWIRFSLWWTARTWIIRRWKSTSDFHLTQSMVQIALQDSNAVSRRMIIKLSWRPFRSLTILWAVRVIMKFIKSKWFSFLMNVIVLSLVKRKSGSGRNLRNIASLVLQVHRLR